MELKYKGEPDMKTKEIRTTLYFKQFIENRILMQVHYPDFEGDDGFSKFMTLHLK